MPRNLETVHQTGLNEDEIKYCHACGKPLHISAPVCPECGAVQRAPTAPGSKNRIVAALFAFFLGVFGIHRFYLGQPIWGIIYLLFFWTFIPQLVAYVEGIIYLCMSDEKFYQKYG